MNEAGKVATSTRYQWLLILLLSVNFGIVFLDRNAFSFMAPFIQPELKLSNAQIGQIAGALSFSWALAGLFMGRLSDLLGRRKLLLVIATVVFSAASILSGFAATFAMLLAARLLMGLAEGGIMPISQTLIASEVAHERRGLAQGVTQNFGANLIANSAGPVVIVAIAVAFGWRSAFFLAAAPGFLLALLILLLVREPAAAPRVAKAKGEGVGPLLRDRTMLLCILISILLVAYFIIFTTFIPLYLVKAKGIAPTDMSFIMAAFGIFSMAYSFLVPGSSDRIGRRPAMVIFALVGALIPVGGILGGSDFWTLFFCFGLGAAISGTFPIVMATIPSELVKPTLTATAMSLTMGISEIVGGVLSPIAAGRIADLYGMESQLWILLGLSLAIALLALFIRETAPAALARRGPVTV